MFIAFLFFTPIHHFDNLEFYGGIGNEYTLLGRGMELYT